MNRFFRSGVYPALMVALLIKLPLAGQTNTGGILGTISDTTGAVVRNAEVSLLNEATGDHRSTVTSPTGDYSFAFLEPGRFTVTVSVPGFRKEIRNGIVLQLNQKARIDFELTVGQVTQEVAVTGQASLLNTDESTLGQVIENKRLIDLPLNGRNFSHLAALMPGVLVNRSSVTAFFGRDSAIAVSASGMPDIYNQITLDGVSAMENRKNRMFFKPSIDAIQEFQVLTGVYSAEYGMNAGAQVNVAIKSGTNRLHGSAYEFLRNQLLDARGYFRPEPLPKDILRRNQFGGVLSGPIRRDRTFFLVNYEGLRQVQQTASTAIVPSLAMREGDFSALSTRIVDPFTRQLFPENIIPANRISPVYRNVVPLMPLPNQTGTQNLAGTSDTDHNEDQFFTRIDHKITDNDRLFGRYVYSQLIYDQSGLNKAFSTLTRVREQNVALNWTHVFSPTILNEVRLGYQRSIWTDRGPRTDTDFDAGQVLGISGIQTPSGTGVPSNLRGYPTFQVQGFLGLSDGGRGLRDLSETRQFVNNLSVTRSAHNLKMGVDLRLVRDDIPGSNVPRGLFAFTGELSGNAWADLVLGLPRNVNNAEGNPTPELRGERYAAYMQDDWKISRKLTVNLGVRWEYFTVIHDISGISRTLRFDLPGGPQLWPEPGTPANLYDSQPFRFFPRVGIAYRMTDKTVIRSGYGRFQIANAFTFLSPPSRNPPFFGAPLIQNPLPPDAPIVDLSNPFAVPASVPTFPQLQVIDPDFKNGDMQNWSFNVGHQFTQNDVLEIGYVGTKGTHGVRSDYNFNQPRPGPGAVQPRRPIPQFSRIRMFRSDYNSHSSSMHVRFEHRFSRGFSVHSSYAWSHQIDEDFSGQDNVDAVPIGPQDSLDRRSERGHGAFDVRHRFTASYIWEMPFARTSGSRLARILLRDWTVDGILTLQTGFPFTVIQSGDSQGADNGVGPDNSGQARPDILPGARITASDPDPARWFNTDAFSRSTFHFGNAGRNILFGPGTRTFALGIFRAIPLPREGHRLQFRYEVFNLFNTPNFGQPGNTLGTGNFGRITSTIGDSRQMQFALKYMF